jgi:hypothetical protein
LNNVGWALKSRGGESMVFGDGCHEVGHSEHILAMFKSRKTICLRLQARYVKVRVDTSTIVLRD